MLEKAPTVLSTVLPSGVMLHNYARHQFLELDHLGYALWALLDGARSVDEALARCVAAHRENGKTASSPAVDAQSARRLRPQATRALGALLAGGFLVERPR